MSEIDTEEILLMIVPERRQVFPFVTSGLNVTFGPPKTVIEEFGAAIFLKKSGFLFSIESAEFVSTLLTCIKSFYDQDDDWGILNTPYAEVEKTVSATKTFTELHAIMDFPEADLCLDAL